jgi:hypothetical protein
LHQQKSSAFCSFCLEVRETEAKYKMRCSTSGGIWREMSSAATNFHCDVSLLSHYTFVMGDLNLHMRLPDCNPGSQEHIDKTHSFVEKKDWDCNIWAMFIWFQWYEIYNPFS